MASDEDKAFEMLRKNLEIHKSSINKHRGTLIKEMGDGLLISFNLASDAVNCAIDIQNACKKEEIPLKIGIHEGEMVYAGSDVLGDSVNIASRLQEGADEGCIFISGVVYNDIKNRVVFKTEFIGEKNFKGLQETIKVHNVISEETLKRTETGELSDGLLPDRKSIIVLPFQNISSDPEQEYFSDGLTEEIITDLSFIHDLLVISRSSAMTYKGTKKKIKEIAKEVNVQYVLEGSVRKAGNNIRIIAQLIDGIHDTHLWAEKYSGTLDNIFDIQEKVSLSIAKALQLKLSPKENQNISERPINDAHAYDLYLKAREKTTDGTEEGLSQALQLINNGLSITGDNEILFGAKGYIYFNYLNILGQQKKKNLQKVKEYANKIFELNPHSYMGHWLMSLIHLKNQNIQKSCRSIRKSLEDNPTHIDSLIYMSYYYTTSGKTSLANHWISKLIKIAPLDIWAQYAAGEAESEQGNFEKALFYFSKMYKLAVGNPIVIFIYGRALALANNVEESIEVLNKAKDLSPDLWLIQLSRFFMHALQKEKTKALKYVSEDLKTKSAGDEQAPLWMAECYALIGEKEEAINWLQILVDWGFINYPFLNEINPFLENIRGEKRFKALMEKVKHQWENFKV
jgi:TolB-like protein/Tfp pilus assembly protein PilF